MSGWYAALFLPAMNGNGMANGSAQSAEEVSADDDIDPEAGTSSAAGRLYKV